MTRVSGFLLLAALVFCPFPLSAHEGQWAVTTLVSIEDDMVRWKVFMPATMLEAVLQSKAAQGHGHQGADSPDTLRSDVDRIFPQFNPMVIDGVSRTGTVTWCSLPEARHEEATACAGHRHDNEQAIIEVACRLEQSPRQLDLEWTLFPVNFVNPAVSEEEAEDEDYEPHEDIAAVTVTGLLRQGDGQRLLKLTTKNPLLKWQRLASGGKR